jgi:protein-disulfide isomerase
MRLTAREKLDVISTTVVVFAVLTMLAFYLHDRKPIRSPWEAAHTYVEEWREWDESGIRIGAEEASMVVTVFSDFCCPFCRDLVPVLDSLRAEFPDDVAIEHHHFPLNRHEFAVPSAVAAECADQQGVFPAFYRMLFSQMDSIGSKAWGAFAAEAGVLDLPAFEECIQAPPDDFPRIAAGRALGERISVRSVPSVWVNGEAFLEQRILAAFLTKARELGL